MGAESESHKTLQVYIYQFSLIRALSECGVVGVSIVPRVSQKHHTHPDDTNLRFSSTRQLALTILHCFLVRSE